MIVIRDQQLRLLVLAQLIRELQHGVERGAQRDPKEGAQRVEAPLRTPRLHGLS